MSWLYIALVHYPVSNKRGEVVATSITNLDIHDLARSARTFGVRGVYFVTPVPSQQWFARRIIVHWSKGVGAAYNPTRKEAVELVRLVDNLEAVSNAIHSETGRRPLLVATTARQRANAISYGELRQRIQTSEEPHCVVFGTGWGLHSDLFDQMDFVLEPIRGPGEYRHLSVRAAVAIVLDRLIGR
ncbi:RNA methyltransferase [Candidatus Sumerlaeota bacterium]|nr:RNA methyltransferase [Candidatus Sumerlaeota bacterium]